MRGGWADGVSEDRVGFGGEEDLGGRGWEATEMMVLWVRVVETLTEEFWGAMEGEGMVLLGDDNAGEGRLGVNEVISEAVGSLEDSLEGVSEEEFTAKEVSAGEDTDTKNLADG